MATQTLDGIGKQIEHLAGQLKALQGQYQTQKGDLETLQKHKQTLEAQLGKVETEIAHLMGSNSVKSRPAAPKSTAKPAATPSKKKSPAKTQTKTKKASKTDASQPPLRVVVTDILENARSPMKARELADRVLETGYKTKSKDFVAVVYDLLSKMDSIENVPKQGYRLK